MPDADDYQLALIGLLPPGRAWPRSPTSVLGRVLGAHADGLARIDAAAIELVGECDPRNANLMLPEWATLLGVPEPGTENLPENVPFTADRDDITADTTVTVDQTSILRLVVTSLSDAQLVAQVVAKVLARGGQSTGYFVSIAAALGFTVNITRFTVARIGKLRIGQRTYGSDWAYTWCVNVTAAPVGFIAPGTAIAPGVTAGTNVLEIILKRLEPAYGAVIFNYEALSA